LNDAPESEPERTRQHVSRQQNQGSRILCRFPATATAAALILLLYGAAFAAGVETIRPSASIALFNGTNLTGWTTWLVDTKRADPRRVFTVTNGLLRISGEGLGYLASEREFRDYRLVAEFKWGRTNWAWGDRLGKARDSGIFLHSTGPDGNSHDGNGAFRAAIECQIMQGSVGDLLLILGRAGDGSLIAPKVTVETASEPDADGWPFWRRGGPRRVIERWGRVNWFGKARPWKDEIDFRGPNDVEGRWHEWTRVECLCAGGRIAVTINGTLVNEAFEVSPRAGSILLQCEGSEIYFRRVELWPIEPR
jgi:hypothetical protein